MANSKRGSATYGFPIYCGGWVPPLPTSAGDGSPDSRQPETASNSFDERLLVSLGGGGGEGRSGVPNVLAVAAVDAGSLSETPVIRLGTGSDVPYRMAMHPKGDGVLCAFLKGCRWFEWQQPEGTDSYDLTLSPSEKVLAPLDEACLQQALCFNGDGSILASGSENGELRAFKWPEMGIILEESVDNSSVKDLDFSPDGKYLVSLRNTGPCRVWDTSSGAATASLLREAGEIFTYCRFYRNSSYQFIYMAAMQDDYGKIITWNTSSWTRVNSKKITRETISAFTVSPDGDLLAIGTIEGTIMVLGTRDMQLREKVKKAHLGIITTLAFSKDSKNLLSSSFDSTARITVVKASKSTGISMWVVIFVILVAIVAYYIQSRGA